MSQAGIISIAGGGGGGSPIETITGDSGGPVPPTANNINLLGGTSTVNNNNGITTVGNAGTSTETITLTNRFQGTGSTIGATTADIVTFALGVTPGTYTLNFFLSGFDAVTPSGVQYTISGGVRTTGAAATLIGRNIDVNSEAALVASIADLVISANNVILRVTGVAGLTISWSAVGSYVRAT